MLVQILEGIEEEGVVFPDRATYGATDLGPVQSFRLLSFNVGGVELIVSQEIEEASVKLVGSRAGNHVGDRALSASKLGLIAAHQNLEFLNRVLNEKLGKVSIEHVVVIQAVHQERVCDGTFAEDGDV